MHDSIIIEKRVFLILVIILPFVSFSSMHPGTSYSEEVDDQTHSESNTGINVDFELRAAINNSDREKVRSFIEQGADVNKIYEFEDGLTPLFEAIARSNGSADIVTYLLRHGADPKAKYKGSSALSMTIRTGHEPLVTVFSAFAEDSKEFYELAVFYWKSLQGETALSHADAALKLNPLNYHAWELKASIFFSQKNLKNAEMAYRMAFETSLANLRTDRSLDNYKAAIWYALLSAHFNEAISLCKEGSSLFPDGGAFFMSTGHALLLLGNRQEALIAYKRSLNAYTLSDETGDDAARLLVKEFAKLKKRYPDKTAQIAWAEKRLEEPFDLSCSEMPFDEEKDDILKLAEGAAIHQDTTNAIEIPDPVLNKHFEEGIRADGHNTQLDPRVVQKYIVKHDKWDSVKQAELFFTAVPGKGKQERLFLVNMEFKDRQGTLDTLFSTIQETLSKEIKSKPVLHSSQRMTRIGSVPAKLAVWEGNDRTVILEVFSTSSLSVQSRLLCVSKKGWDQYLSSLHRNNSQ